MASKSVLFSSLALVGLVSVAVAVGQESATSRASRSIADRLAALRNLTGTRSSEPAEEAAPTPTRTRVGRRPGTAPRANESAARPAPRPAPRPTPRAAARPPQTEAAAPSAKPRLLPDFRGGGILPFNLGARRTPSRQAETRATPAKPPQQQPRLRPPTVEPVRKEAPQNRVASLPRNGAPTGVDRTALGGISLGRQREPAGAARTEVSDIRVPSFPSTRPPRATTGSTNSTPSKPRQFNATRITPRPSPKPRKSLLPLDDAEPAANRPAPKHSEQDTLSSSRRPRSMPRVASRGDQQPLLPPVEVRETKPTSLDATNAPMLRPFNTPKPASTAEARGPLGRPHPATEPQLTPEPEPSIQRPDPFETDEQPTLNSPLRDERPFARPTAPARNRTSPNPRDVFNGSTSVPTSTHATAPAHRQAARRDTFTLTRTMPALGTRLTGPKNATLGRESTYQLVVENQGHDDAEHVVATLIVQGDADVVQADSTAGVSQRTGPTRQSIEWQLPKIAAGKRETLAVTLAPRSNKPFAIDIRLASAPLAANTSIAVHEPMLKLDLQGPEDLLVGERKRYSVRVANPGTGDTEDVVVKLAADGAELVGPLTRQIGLIRAGQEKTLDVELIAGTQNNMQLRAIATSRSQLTDTTDLEATIRRPQVSVDIRGPAASYAGTPASYYLRVQNPGNADAESVMLNVNLPRGAALQTATDGYQVNPRDGSVRWNVGTLKPGDDMFFQLQCVLDATGEQRIAASVQGDGHGLQDTVSTSTTVEALADLKLEVSDPKGAVAVGEQVVYEIRIVNRGDSAAESINVVALFSEGIEPTSVEGAQHTVRNGRVSLKTIDSLPAGRDVTIKIRAEAYEAGTHIFRAEVRCEAPETTLAAEETTRFYKEQYARRAPESSFQSARQRDTAERQ